MIVSWVSRRVNRVHGLSLFVNKVLTLTMSIVLLFAAALSEPAPPPRPLANTAIATARAQIIQAERVSLKTIKPRKRSPLMRIRDFE
jgi:hypothetical protein